MNPKNLLIDVRLGLVIAGGVLLFGIALGITFGIYEDAIKAMVADGVAAHPELHKPIDPSKIFRWWQRAHFHATGIGPLRSPS